MKNYPLITKQHFTRIILAIAMATSAGFSAIGQSSTNESSIFDLSAFVVETNSLNTYRALDTISATGINSPILDTPITINVLTEGRLLDNAVSELHEIVDTIPSVQTAIRNESSFNIRGFSALAIFRNGHYRRQLFPTWNIDRVEIIKGPSAIFHGQARPGGVINYITRRPSNVKATSIRTRVGGGDIAHSQYRAELTTTGPISDTLSYRVGAGYWEGGDWHTDWRNRETYIGGSLLYQPNDKLSISIDLEHINRERSDGETLVQPFMVDTNGFRDHMPDSFYGGPERRYTQNIGGSESWRDYTSNTAETEILYRPTDWLVLKQNINYSEDNFDVLRTFVTPVSRSGTSSIANVHVGNFANWRDNYSYDTAAVMTMRNEYFSNTFQTGIDIQQILNTTPGYGRINGRLGPVFKYDMATGEFPDFPNKAAEYPLSVQTYVNEFEGSTRHGQWNDQRRRIEKQDGFYFINMTDLFNERLKALWGMRYTETSCQEYWDSQPADEWDDRYASNDAWMPQVGLNYTITEGITAFAVYSEAMELNNRQDADGNSGEPVESHGYDIGLKFNLPNTGLYGTINYYLLNRGNQVERDFDREDQEGRGPFYIFGLEQESSGIEIDLSYQPIENWQVSLTFSSMFKHEIVASLNNPETVGEEFAVIEDQWSIWTRYEFVDGALKGLVIGGGVKWEGDRKDRLWTDGVQYGSWTKVDLFAKYVIPTGDSKYTHTIGLNINNLLDEYEVFRNDQMPRMFFVNYTLDF